MAKLEACLCVVQMGWERSSSSLEYLKHGYIGLFTDELNVVLMHSQSLIVYVEPEPTWSLLSMTIMS